MSPFRKEFSALLTLALPILGTQLAQTGNAFVDTVMAGSVGAVDLAAVAVGASAWVPVYLFMTGVLMAGTPVLSRHVGSSQMQRVNPIAQQLLYLALLLGTAGFFLLRSLDPLLEVMDVDPELLPKVSAYLRALSWGMPAAALVIALRAYTEALSNPRPVLLISIAGLALNIPANYIFIYGKLGVPAMGGVGCGWATTLVLWFMASALGGYIALHKSYQS
ncbi:MAG TPA: MATE family efflux transporter, partial [Spongiibacteraceae bacterium]|nr:MATE family efflux transporter [Spongiibacteraceae bacterium]